ncbi:MAG: cation:dicarboxylase symporter family transporter, partial [Opitutales bacterium]
MHKLTIWILYAMGLGLLAGLLLNWGREVEVLTMVLTDGVLYVVGQIFLALLMVLVVPVVGVSLVSGTAALDDVRRLGRLGGRTVLFYLGTTVIAIGMALFAAIAIGPGRGFELESQAEITVQEAPPLTQILIDLFPRNVFNAAADGNILQVIVFSILFGMAMTMAGQAGARVLRLFQDLMEIVMKLVTIVMWLAPIGVFALIARVFATEG